MDAVDRTQEGRRRLAAFAFEREHAAAHREWSRLDPDAQRAAMADPDVLLSVVSHAAAQLAESGADAEHLGEEIRSLIDGVAADLRWARREFPLEWFQALEPTTCPLRASIR